MEDGAEHSVTGGPDGAVTHLFHSLLFSTRKFNAVAWQVKFKIPFKMITYQAAPNIVKKSVVDEMKSLKALIAPKAADGRMNIIEVREFLAVLGLGGQSLYAESNALGNADFDEMMDWYWTHRSHYFPSSRSSLNEMTYLEVKKYINIQEVLGPKPVPISSNPFDNMTSSNPFDTVLDDDDDDEDDDEGGGSVNDAYEFEDSVSDSCSDYEDDDGEDEGWLSPTYANAPQLSSDKISTLQKILKRGKSFARDESFSVTHEAPSRGSVFGRLFHRKQQEAKERLRLGDSDSDKDGSEDRMSETASVAFGEINDEEKMSQTVSVRVSETSIRSETVSETSIPTSIPSETTTLSLPLSEANTVIVHPLASFPHRSEASEIETSLPETSLLGDRQNLTKIQFPTPMEEHCHFREILLGKIPGFDIGMYIEEEVEGGKNDTHFLPQGNNDDEDVGENVHYGGIGKKGLSTFSFYSPDKVTSHLKKKHKKREHVSLPWEGLFQVFDHNSFEKDWLQQSIILMAELCRGANLHAQTLVNQLFPVPMVLDLLGFGGDNSAKLVVFSLLQNVYVVHDLVFPVTATCRGKRHGVGADDGIVCSLNEGDSSTSFNDAGKVFNDMTRCIQKDDADGNFSSKVLRKMLWRNLSVEVDSIDLNSRENDVLAYHTGLLKFIRKLICTGFFEESSDFEADNQRMKEQSQASHLKVITKEKSRTKNKSEQRFLFSVAPKSSESFNETDIANTLIKNISSMVDRNKNDIDAVRHGVLQILDHWKATNKVSDREHANIRHSVLKDSNPVSLGSENFNLVKDYFSETFSHPIKILLVKEVRVDIMIYDINNTYVHLVDNNY